MSTNDTISIPNLSDDANIKQYVNDVLAPRVFHDIPMNVLNAGFFSLINEHMAQSMEQMAYTTSFYFNESFITKAVLADSIYAEAAIFNIGYSYAIPSSCMFLLELKIEDIYNNAKLNADTGLYEFILDKNTKFNLSNGNIYSLDYDILISYKSVETSNRNAQIPAWNVQYINTDEKNYVATNKDIYIKYRVTDVWLCLFVNASEYVRETHVVMNNMTNGIPNEDKVITCNNHICGFDIKYIDGNGNSSYLSRDHILPIHSSVKDDEPYVHYIMDNPQTIRFMFQLNGNRYFVPRVNSSFEITVYTCHGESANFTAYDQYDQPNVITSTNKYSDNANVMKAAFVISGSMGGTNIGTTETVRRETIEAYNTANVLSTDHDIDEWFKTFYFKNVLYPFFFKRRDDPWGRIWSGFIALKDSDDYIFRTNTLHCKIPYEVLYNNNDNTVNENEIIIPPGWLWIYGNENRFTVVPYTKGDGKTVESAKTSAGIKDKFIFCNPFGIRIQKNPFAIAYFNPWINEYVSTSKIDSNVTALVSDDISVVYHGTPITTNIVRTYKDDYYKFTTYISPTITSWIDGTELVRYVRKNAVAPTFVDSTWIYFNKPKDMFASNIPMTPIDDSNGYIPFNPSKTYFCVKTKNRIDDNRWALSDIWIDDESELNPKRIFIPITGDISMLFGYDDVWGDEGLWKGYEVYVSGDTDISLYPEVIDDDHIEFERMVTQNYYVMKLDSSAVNGHISKIVVGEAIKTKLTKYGNTNLVKIGKSYAQSTYINVYFSNNRMKTFSIANAANIYMPYDFTKNENNEYVFDFNEIGPNGVILYADMKPAPDSGAVEYYRIPLSSAVNKPLFYIANKLLPLDKNNMRVILHAYLNGSESGYIEMQPVSRESDNSYCFETFMYPLNEMIDVDNRINIASIYNGGGTWIPTSEGANVSIDAINPEFKISILIRTSDPMRDSDVVIGDTYTGFRIVDEYVVDDISLLQELKEMRSVVNFGESSIPSVPQKVLYQNFISLDEYDESVEGTIADVRDYAYSRMHDIYNGTKFQTIKRITTDIKKEFDTYVHSFMNIIPNVSETPKSFVTISEQLNAIINSHDESGNDVEWNDVFDVLNIYKQLVNEAFSITNVNGGLEIQLVPLVEKSLMMSERFTSFVSSFTQVHKAIEPVIMKRLEGNNYLDCKLLATYGLPHSYSSDIDFENPNIFWPDLNVQIEFDVKLFNPSLTTNTINELKLIVKSYFNRLTSIHTPADATKMDDNIYVSHLIQQMEEHSNVAYMKFKGFYTNEKNKIGGNYMNSETQAIVKKWKDIESMPTQELERYVPEMFVLDDDNIIINIL